MSGVGGLVRTRQSWKGTNIPGTFWEWSVSRVSLGFICRSVGSLKKTPNHKNSGKEVAILQYQDMTTWEKSYPHGQHSFLQLVCAGLHLNSALVQPKTFSYSAKDISQPSAALTGANLLLLKLRALVLTVLTASVSPFPWQHYDLPRKAHNCNLRGRSLDSFSCFTSTALVLFAYILSHAFQVLSILHWIIIHEILQ